MAQRIMIDWGKNQLQKAYRKDKGANLLRKQKWEDDNIQEREGVLYWKGRIYLPVALREEWTRKIHEHLLTGHPGIGRMVEQVARTYYFPGITRTARKIVTECNVCNRTKYDRHAPYGKLQTILPGE